ncbi:methyltransferase [Flavobacteriaceae bacterium F08102]|nr:methyltransferase [Flavobacteriaceae bacterium F08102]
MVADFKFKQFTIKQDQAAMKVGTDGVLLGGWTTLDHAPNSILDIGTGTGLIALQLAQRSEAELIDAIEIDDKGYEEAVQNFENSDWGDRLFCYHCSLAEFTEEMDEQYELIVTNPPFYQELGNPADIARNSARSTRSLSFESLAYSVSKLLSPTGLFSLILPAKEYDHFVALAHKNGLFLNRCCFVKGHSKTPPKRVLLEFSFSESELLKSMLTIEIERHVYTPEYIKLVKDFYLKM